MLAPLRVCPKCHTEYDPPSSRCSFDGSLLLDPVDAEGADTPAFGVPIVASTLGTLGPYKLLSTLGDGSMAVVYAAEHSKLGRRCAIKRLRAEHLVDREMVERFVAEARTVAGIQHPNLATIYDVVEEPDEVYVVMELLDGRDLQAALQTGSLTIDRALRIGGEMCDALAPVHARGIVHRDVKPANIFLCIVAGREQVKMLDFGAARLLGKGAALDERMEREGATLGSPLYMSPEQVSGGTLDGRSDLYSIGIVLYEMLVGQPPFVGETYSDVLLQHIHQPPQPFAARGVAVSRDVEQIVMRCLEKKPENRFETAGELARELRRVGAPLGLSYEQPNALSVPLGSQARRRGAGAGWIVPAVGVGFLLAAGALAITLSRHDGSAKSVPAVVANLSPSPPAIETPVVAPASPGVPQPAPLREVHVESRPEGARAQPDGSLGACTTPCILALPSASVGITFHKVGFQDTYLTLGATDTACLGELQASVLDERHLPAAAHAADHKRRAEPRNDITDSATLNPFGPK